ncbi:AAA family ATPase [Legionella drancourtii]|uniref:Rad50/SbcC-type AAA domain-containing protein n=1 Tax=Legionella drancourtii LLAP12 TaxID=658187 RepID=G9ENH4_9GAMM|nr:AAA family ATPase [Legionella drancourtii]EHL31335.1 hypothetical protein LDG_6797 [Legionella drancourtii LLAP12]
MIRIESITIENLRGIKRLHHNLGHGNLVIQGPNGSGKSGIIDAIEFALTGNISRLSGTGSSGVTLSIHAPHVDFRDNPRKAKAIIKVTNDLTGNSFTIERTVAHLKKPKIEPENEEGKIILNFLSEHPEFSLSRREILKFIVTEPSKRAKEVQELLKMDSIDKIRSVFNKLNNETKRSFTEKSNNLTQAEKALLQHFEMTEINKNNMLKLVNDMRAILILDKIESINIDTKFSIGLGNDTQNNKKTVDKKVLCPGINSLLIKLEAKTITTSLEATNEAIVNLQSNYEFLQYVNKQEFYEKGLNFIIDNFCPFCDTAYDLQLLISHIQQKIADNVKAATLLSTIQSGCNILKSDYIMLLSELDEIKRGAFSLNLTSEAEKLVALSERIKLDCEFLDSPIDNLEKVTSLIKDPYGRFDVQIVVLLQSIFTCVNKIPDYSSEENAKRFLIIADERLDAYKFAKHQISIWDKRAQKTTQLLSLFESISEKKLVDLYAEVEKDFSRFYSQINNDDEKEFNAQLTPSKGSLGLDVDFYGRGVFPPLAFHSEGHQDGMGLCLYLALSKKIMGNKFTFCLLDDVLMSIDTSHRRAFCILLKSEFPLTQFVITTHDEIWKKQLINEGFVSSKQVLNFRGWSVDNGPSFLNEKDTLETLDRCIKEQSISEAASILRHYLEYIMTELSIKLRVKLEIRYNNSYDFGETLSAVISRYKELLKKAKTAANSWNQQDIVGNISFIDTKLIAAIQKTNLEQWTLNPSVHYNEWANFTSNEFSRLKEAFFELLNQFKCAKCDGWIYASPSKGNVDEVRCECGELLLNFKTKN